MGYPSLFEYCVQALELSPSQAYTMTSVSRKCREVPELKKAVESEKVSISNAKRIVPVINTHNQSLWIEKAEGLSTRALEKEVVKVSPRAVCRKR